MPIVFRAIVYRWLLGTFLFLLLFGCVIAWTLLTPRKYEARFKVLVKNERPQALVSPAPDHGSVVRSDVAEEQVNSEIELLTSGDVLRQIVRRARLDELETGAANDARRADALALRRLRSSLSVKPVRNSSVIEVSYEGPDPERVLAVTETLVESYFDAHLSIHRSSGAFQFFDQQVATLRNELEEADDLRSSFSQRWELTDIERQKDLILQRREETRSIVDRSEAELNEAIAKETAIRRQLGDLEDQQVVRRRKVPNQYSVERLHTLVAELENERIRLLTGLRADDREVLQVEDQIAQTKAALEEAKKFNSVEEETATNPLREQLLADLARVAEQAAAAGARRKAYAASMEVADRRLAELDELTAEYRDLQRRVDTAEQNLVLYSRKREEARVSESLDSQKIGNVAMLESPTLPVLPSSPNTAFNLAFGSALSALLALGLVVGREATAGIVRVPTQLAQASRAPVLGILPAAKS